MSGYREAGVSQLVPSLVPVTYNRCDESFAWKARNSFRFHTDIVGALSILMPG
jgi:hypothetical protein